MNTTTEFLTKHIFDQLAEAARAQQARPRGPRTEGDPRHHFGIACGARLLRGAIVVSRVAFAVPGDLATPTGGYAYDRRIIAELQKLGWQVDVVGARRWLSEAERGTKGAAETVLAGVPRACPIVIDGLAFGVLPEAAASCASETPLIALVHHPLALETGFRPTMRKPAGAANARRSPRRRGDRAPAHSTARLLVDRTTTWPPRRITVACPGTDRAPLARRKQRRHAAAAFGRRDRAAQRLRRSGRGAGRPARSALASDHRRRPHARSGGGGAARRRYRAAWAWRAHRRARRGAGRAHRRALRASPICSCWPRASRATAWPMPRRWRTACRWSAPPPARFPIRCRRSRHPGRAGRRERRSPRRCAMLIANPTERALARLRRARRGAGAADLAGFRQAVRRRDRGRGMSGFSADWLALREPYDRAPATPR